MLQPLGLVWIVGDNHQYLMKTAGLVYEQHGSASWFFVVMMENCVSFCIQKCAMRDLNYLTLNLDFEF